MLDHAAGSFRLDDHPCGVTLFQLISDLHARAWRRARLGPKDYLRMGLPTFKGDAIHIHVHGAQVEGVERSEMLRDSSANGVGIALLLLHPHARMTETANAATAATCLAFFNFVSLELERESFRNLRLNELQFSNLLASLGGQICWPEGDADLLQKCRGRLAAGEDPHVVVGKFLN